MAVSTEPGRYITDVEFNNVLAEKFKQITGSDVDVDALLKKLFDTVVDDYSYIKKSSNKSASLKLKVNGRTLDLTSTLIYNQKISGSFYNLTGLPADKVYRLSIDNGYNEYTFEKDLINLTDLSVYFYNGPYGTDKITYFNFKYFTGENLKNLEINSFYLNIDMPEFIGANLEHIIVPENAIISFKNNEIYLPKFTGEKLQDDVSNSFYTKNHDSNITLKKINLPNFTGNSLVLGSLNNYNGLLQFQHKLQEIILPNFVGKNVISLYQAFYSDSSLEYIDFPKFTGIQTKADMNKFCSDASYEKFFNLISGEHSYKYKNSGELYQAFVSCVSLKYVNMPNFIGYNIIDLENAFYNCNELQTISLDSFDPSCILTVKNMCHNCPKLKSVKMPKIKYISNFSYMFYDCSSLEEVYLDSFMGTRNIDKRSSPEYASVYEIFHNCPSLKKVYMPKYMYDIRDESFEDYPPLEHLYISTKCFNSSKNNLTKTNPGKLIVHAGDSSYKYINNKWQKV